MILTRGEHMFDKMFGNINFYKSSLDGLSVRRQSNLQNIANQNTPNYKRKVVSFEDQLKNAVENKGVFLTKTNSKHLGINRGEVVPVTTTDRSDSYRFDGNNVNIDTENLEMWKTYYQYSAMTDLVSKEFDKYRNIINEVNK